MCKCKNCSNLYNLSNQDDEIVGKWCEKKNDSPDTELERECDYYKCMTNGDRIRSMTDEELSDFLMDVTMGKLLNEKIMNVKNWIQSESKEEI